MAEALLLEFDGVGLDHYQAVNAALGIDAETGEGDWPEGLVSHTGGAKPGGWVVFEVWEPQDAQAKFMEERLERALEQGNTPPPARVEWLALAAHRNLS